MTTVITQHHPSAAQRPWLQRRWPTALSIAAAIPIAILVGDGRDLSFVLLLSALCYTVSAALDAGGAAWVVGVSGPPVVGAMKLADLDSTLVLAAVGVLVAAVGTVARRTDPNWWVQVGAFVSLWLLAEVGESGPVVVGTLLVAAGLFAHGAWDTYHHHVDRVVNRSFAEWCGMFDVLLGLIAVSTLLTL